MGNNNKQYKDKIKYKYKREDEIININYRSSYSKDTLRNTALNQLTIDTLWLNH